MAATIPTLDEIRAAVREEIRDALRSSQPETMTVEQAAAYTGRAPKTIRGWILAGLACTHKGRRVHVKRGDLDTWLAAPQKAGEPDAIVASLRSTG